MPTSTSLLQSFAIQRRVIRALMLRELITRFGRENLGVLWLVGEPMIFTLGVAALWSAMRAHQFSSLPIIAFAITGYSSVLVWRNTVRPVYRRHRRQREPSLSPQRSRDRRLRDADPARARRCDRLVRRAGGDSSSLPSRSTRRSTRCSVVVGWAMLGWFGGALAPFHRLGDRLQPARRPHLAPCLVPAVPAVGCGVHGGLAAARWTRSRPAAPDGAWVGADPGRVLRQCSCPPTTTSATWRPVIWS